MQLLIQKGLFSLNMNSLFCLELKTDGGVTMFRILQMFATVRGPITG